MVVPMPVGVMVAVVVRMGMSVIVVQVPMAGGFMTRNHFVSVRVSQGGNAPQRRQNDGNSAHRFATGKTHFIRPQQSTPSLTMYCIGGPGPGKQRYSGRNS